MADPERFSVTSLVQRDQSGYALCAINLFGHFTCAAGPERPRFVRNGPHTGKHIRKYSGFTKEAQTCKQRKAQELTRERTSTRNMRRNQCYDDKPEQNLLTHRRSHSCVEAYSRVAQSSQCRNAITLRCTASMSEMATSFPTVAMARAPSSMSSCFSTVCQTFRASISGQKILLEILFNDHYTEVPPQAQSPRVPPQAAGYSRLICQR